MAAGDGLLLETPAFPQPAAFRSVRLAVPEPALGAPAFRLRAADTGGGAYLSHSADGGADRVLLWEFTEEEPDVLRLAEAAPGGDLAGAALKLRFPSPLHPQALLIGGPDGSRLVLLSARGVLHALQLPPAAACRPGASVLAEFAAPGATPGGLNAVASVPLQGWAEGLGSPTCLAAAHGCVAIGGSSGAICCIPHTAFGTGGPAGAFELAETRSVLSSLFGRAAQSPVADLQALEGSTFLLALHVDGSLRSWDAASGRRLAASALLSEAAGLVARKARLAARGEGGRKLAVLFEPCEGSGGGGAQVGLFTLTGSGGLEAPPAGLTSVEGSVDDLLPWHDPTQGHHAWVLHSAAASQLACVSGEGPEEGPAGSLEGPVGLLLADQTLPEGGALQAALWQGIVQRLAADSAADDSPAAIDESAARHLLQRLLVPGQLSPRALSLALEGLGRSVPVADLKGRPSAEVLDFLMGVAAELEGEAALAAIGRLSAAYAAALESLHPAYALLTHPQTGGVSVVRAGPSLNPLRCASPAEALRHGAAAAARAAAAGEPAAEAAPDERVPRAGGLLVALLGARVAAAALHCLGRPRSAFGGEVVPAMLHSLTGLAYLPGGAAAEHWRLQRRTAALHIQRLLSPIQNLEEALAEALRDAEEPPLMPYAALAGPLGSAAAGACLAAHKAAAAARAELLLGLQLLLGFLQTLPALGTWQPSGGMLAGLARAAPQVEAALRQAAAVEWLAVTALEEGSQDFAPGALAGFQTLAPPRQGPRLRTRLPARAERTLASLFWGPTGSDQGPSLDTLALGPPAGCGRPAWLLEQVLGIAARLLEARQLQSLARLLTMAGPEAGQSAAVKLLWGYATLASLSRLPDPSARAAAEAAAVQALFQAVAALGALEGSESAQQRPPDARLGRLLTLLERETLGQGCEGPPEAEQLRCCELLLAACEQRGCLAAGSKFALAAAQQAQQLAAAAPEGPARAALQQREGRVWDNLFSFALGAGSFQEAYAALEANPDPSRRLQGLRSLVQALCEARELRTLVALPFSGDMESRGPDGRSDRMPLAEAAAQALLRRAQHASIAAQPQPYLVLADFCAARGDWRRAAAAYLALARRLQGEGAAGPAAAQAVSAHLAAASNALRLTDVTHAWLEDPAAAAAEADPGPTSQGLGPFAPRLAAASRPAAGGGAAAGPQALISAAELSREARAAAALSARGLPCCCTRPAAAVAALQSAGRFPAASALAEAVLEGQAAGAAVRQALTGMARVCARRQAGLTPPDAALNAAGECSWADLRDAVERQTLGNPGGGGSALWQAVAGEILGTGGALQLPAWLLTLFLAGDRRRGLAGGPGDPTALLRVWMSHGRLADAARLALDRLHAWLHEASDLDRQRPLGAWFPHALLQALQASLEGSSDPGLRSRGSELAAARRQLAALSAQQAALLTAGRRETLLGSGGAARGGLALGPGLVA